MELLDADIISGNDGEPFGRAIFTHLARCLSSTHFQVQERSLYLWNNEHLVNVGCMSKRHSQLSLRLLYTALHNMAVCHWNKNVEQLSQNVIKLYMAYDLKMFNQVSQDHMKEQQEKEELLTTRKVQWAALEAQVAKQQAEEEADGAI